MHSQTWIFMSANPFAWAKMHPTLANADVSHHWWRDSELHLFLVFPASVLPHSLGRIPPTTGAHHNPSKYILCIFMIKHHSSKKPAPSSCKGDPKVCYLGNLLASFIHRWQGLPCCNWRCLSCSFSSFSRWPLGRLTCQVRSWLCWLPQMVAPGKALQESWILYIYIYIGDPWISFK